MSTIIIRHRVSDFDTWKKAYDEHGAMRREHGITDISLHRDEADPNMVSAILRASDLGRARAFAGSDDLREAMTRAGVTSQPDVWFTTDV